MADNYSPPLEDQTLETVLDRISSPAETPGGGSVAALAGALASSLLSMVARFSLSHNSGEQATTDFEAIVRNADNYRRRFTRLLKEDAQKLEDLLEAQGARDKTGGGAGPDTEFQQALKAATEPPFETAELGTKLLDLISSCAKSGSQEIVSDAGVAGTLAYASISSALYNVDINLKSIEDEAFVRSAKGKRAEIIQEAETSKQEVLEIVQAQITN